MLKHTCCCRCAGVRCRCSEGLPYTWSCWACLLTLLELLGLLLGLLGLPGLTGRAGCAGPAGPSECAGHGGRALGACWSLLAGSLLGACWEPARSLLGAC